MQTARVRQTPVENWYERDLRLFISEMLWKCRYNIRQITLKLENPAVCTDAKCSSFEGRNCEELGAQLFRQSWVMVSALIDCWKTSS